MPLQVGPLTPTPAPPVPPPSPLVSPPDVGSITATWTDPTGTVWQLSNPDDTLGYFTPDAIAGWGARPYEFTTDPVPRGGDEVRFVRAQAGRVTWPLHIWGDTHLEFVGRYRALRQAFMSTVGYVIRPGTLRVARPDGTAREIDAYYEDGFAGEPGADWVWSNPVLTLYCPDGYWRDVAQVSVPRFYSSGSPQSYLAPYPRVSKAQTLGATTIGNPGDVEAWSTWTITGPMTSITATSATLGQAWTLTYTLTTGQVATVSTAPRPTLRGPAGQNLIGNLDWPTAYLWPLLPGANDVSIAVSGGGSATRVDISFYPRYLGA